MAKEIQATHLYPEGLMLCVQEFQAGEPGARVMVRATAKGLAMTCGLDLTAADALELAEALTQHANALNEAALRAKRLKLDEAIDTMRAA